jgi:uncharacterized small protein (DUF1192 family)
MSALAPILTNSSMAQPLYAIEEHLVALIDTVELVTPAEEQQFRSEFQRALSEAVEKRDRVGQFMAHLEDQIAFATSEIERLKARRSVYQRAFERVEDYVTSTIKMLGADVKGKYRKLEGRTITFGLAGCPPSVEVTDESAIPAEYKVLTFKLPALTWAQLLDFLDPSQRAAVSADVKCQEVTVDKRAIKSAITEGSSVAGANLATGKTWLKRS